MTALLIIIIVLGLIGVVQFNRRAIDREVIVQLRRDNRDKRDLREAFRESLRENEQLTRTIKMLQDDSYHNNEALRKENARLVEENLNLSTQLQNQGSCLVSFGPKNYSVLVRGIEEYFEKLNQERNGV